MSVEVGGGIGNFKETLRDIVSMDIQHLPWVDLVGDGHFLPFRDGVLANIFLVDALHHLAAPRLFFEEAARVLRVGGRIIMIEPEISALSYLVYKFMHPEPVDTRADPLHARTAMRRDPFDSNQAIPHILMNHGRAAFIAAFPCLAIRRYERFSPFSYCLSGGFRPWSLIPERLVGSVLRIEDRITPLLRPIMAFRLLAVIEKYDGPAAS